MEKIEKLLIDTVKFNQVQLEINEENTKNQRLLHKQIKAVQRTLVIVSLCFGVAILGIGIILL